MRWLLGLVVGLTFFAFPVASPVDGPLLGSTFFAIFGLILIGTTKRPFRHALRPNRSVKWSGVWLSGQFPDHEPTADLLPSLSTYRELDASTRGRFEEKRRELETTASIHCGTFRIRFDQLLELRRREAGQLPRKHAKAAVELIPAGGVMSALSFVIALLTLREAGAEYVFFVTKLIAGFGIGLAMPSPRDLSVSLPSWRQLWLQVVLEERLVFAAFAGVPDTVLEVLRGHRPTSVGFIELVERDQHSHVRLTREFHHCAVDSLSRNRRR
ncbi:MAG: hypothetical protein DI536_33895 [Archangium gephyra]|uniref:Uncharacterized protein n=1 Tax=Archangium gephyra TaxID=48 RepID=A0A2W5V3T0_9BACT|nr:MAG: hypothetical protein DI536_33895 [Archangium gephyra]